MAMDFFGIMVSIGVVMLMALIYFYFFENRFAKGEKITVSYSERIGETTVEHGSYLGVIVEKTDTLIIPKLKLKRPIPPRKAMLHTTTGKKKVYMVKIDVDRFAYRIPSLKNRVYTEKLDENGKPALNKNGKPILIKHKWLLCDDVVEPDVKHWEEHAQDQIRERHKARESAFEKWIAPATVAVLAITAVMLNSQSTRMVAEDKRIIMEQATEAQADAKRTTDALNNLLEKVGGQRILSSENQDRQEYYNETS